MDIIKKLDYSKNPFIILLDKYNNMTNITVWSIYDYEKKFFSLKLNNGGDNILNIPISESDFYNSYNIHETDIVKYDGGGNKLKVYLLKKTN